MKVCVFDLETTINSPIHGPDAKDPVNEAVTWIWGNNPDNIIIKHGIEGKFGFLDDLQDCDMIIGHNLKFDLAYIWNEPLLQKWVVNGGKVWDTQVAEYILTGQQHRLSSLAEIQEKHLGQKSKLNRISRLYERKIGADKILKARHRCKRLYRVYEQYCYDDGRSTLEVFKKQYIKSKNCDMLAICQLYNDYLLALCCMENTGIHLDIPKAEELATQWRLKSIEHSKKSRDIIKSVWNNKDLPEFNPNSPDHKSVVMFGGNLKCGKKKVANGTWKNGNVRYKSVDNIVYVPGFQLPTNKVKRLKKDPLDGKPFFSSDDETINFLKANTTNKRFLEYTEHVQKAAAYTKAASTDIGGLLDYSIDGVLYPNFNNTAVVTGRLSSSKPNMQNKAKHSRKGKLIHKLFKAPENFVCVQADFSQLEIWVSAFLSADENLINDLLSGVDMHCLRVSYMVEESYEQVVELCKTSEKWSALRTAAKTFSYQRAYGAGVATLVEETGLSREKVEQIIEHEDKRYPKAAAFFKRVQAIAEGTTLPSKLINLPTKSRPKNHRDGYELIPMFDSMGNKSYNKDNIRQIGYWRSPTQKKYHFPFTGRIWKNTYKENISPTIIKNYPMQGTAADIQGATSYALLKACLLKGDKIKMINEIHDSKWFYVRKDVLEPCIKYIVNVMSDVPKLFKERFNIAMPFKIPVDIEIGPSFGELTKYEL